MDIDNLKVSEGITPEQIDQLISYTKTDAQILKLTSDPERFQSRESFEKWVSERPRTFYTLTDKSATLFGLIWFAGQELPENVKGYEKYGITFSVRLYAKARGKGLSMPFMKEAIDKFKLTEAYKAIKNNGIWIVTRTDNQAARKAYEKFGFRTIFKSEEKGRVLMVLES